MSVSAASSMSLPNGGSIWHAFGITDDGREQLQLNG